MEVSYVRERITQLRVQKGVSEYKMSYELGHSRGYINNISSGKVLPSMAEFLAICDYFEISPSEFFDGKQSDPHQLQKLNERIKKLDADDLRLVSQTVERLLK